MTQDLVFERDQHLGIITLSRQQALNALTLPMIRALQQQLQQWQDDSQIHAIVIQAAPGKAFCAGGDVRWLYESGLAQDPDQMIFFAEEYRLNHFIHQLKKPYIALMDGINMGGGVGISLHGSHPVASERFVFAMPESSIGLFTDIGASYLLSRCPGAMGVFLGLTGNRLGAEDAKHSGLIKHVIDSEQFPEILSRLKELDLSEQAHEKVSACLEAIASVKQRSLLGNSLALIDHYFSASSVKEIVANLKESENPWALAQWENLQQKSPLSLEVIFAQINKANKLSMGECVKMDYCLVGHFMKGADFYEGVRALLIDKDKNPHWQPASLIEVTAGMVANYFECEKPELELIND